MKPIYLLIGFLLISSIAGSYVYFNIFKKAKDQEAMEQELGKKFRKAKLLLEQNTKEASQQAFDILTTILAGHPDSKFVSDIYLAIGELYEKMDMHGMALSKYRKALEHKNISEKTKKRVTFKIAKLTNTTLYEDEAYINLLTLSKEVDDPKFKSEVYTALAKLYIHAKLDRKAIISLKVAIREDPYNLEATKTLANLLKKYPDHKSSFHVYENYLEGIGENSSKYKSILPKYSKKILQKGLEYYGKKKYHKAIEKFKYLIRRHPEIAASETALFYSGESYFYLKKHNDAMRCYKKVLANSISSKDDLSLIRLGELYLHGQNYQKALHYFRKIRNKFPDSKYSQVAKDWEMEVNQLYRDANKLASYNTL